MCDQLVRNSSALLGATAATYFPRLFFVFPRPVFLLLLLLLLRPHRRDVRNEEAGFGAAHAWDPSPPSPPCPHHPCLWALLAQACLSIFVTASKFDVSYSQLTASEPCMNELAIYTKCLIKSAAAPGINIAGRLGMLVGGAEERARVFAQRGVCRRILHLATRQSLCATPAHAAPDANIRFQFHLMLVPIVEDAPHGWSECMGICLPPPLFKILCKMTICDMNIKVELNW